MEFVTDKGTLRGLAICFALAICALAAPTMRSQTWTWTPEDVDNNGKYTSIAVDQAGNVHLSYVNDEKGTRYAFRPAGESHWYTMTVDEPGSFANRTTGIAAGPNGNPYLCYTPGVVQYAHWDGSEWIKQRIAPNWGTVEYTCQIAVASNGKPYVLWYQYGGTDGSTYLHIRCASLEDGTWWARTVDFEGQTGKWNSLALDAEGMPHITYDSFLQGAVKYAVWDGKEWRSSIIESRNTRPGPYNRGMGNSLALLSNGEPVVAYYDDESLKVARRSKAGWTIHEVDSIPGNQGWVSYRSGVVVDSQGSPHVVYDAAGILKHAYWDQSKWRVQALTSTGPDHVRYPSVTINKKDLLFVSYRDPMDGSMKVLVGKPESAIQQRTQRSSAAPK